MSKLTKAKAKAHTEACAVLTKDRLSEDERWFVLENWQESATHVNSTAGAFFTPPMLARDFAIESGGCRTIIDLCAGIGTLAFMVCNLNPWGRDVDRIVCVERNPDYLAIGRKILPEAEWVTSDVFSLANMGRFDLAISNPPFGSTARVGKAPRFAGKSFEYHVIDIASDLADFGVFIVPQNSAPFRYSGQPHYEVTRSDAYDRFTAETSIELTASCGIDCSVYRGDWRGVSPAVEVVLADFIEARERREAARPPTLFDAILKDEAA